MGILPRETTAYSGAGSTWSPRKYMTRSFVALLSLLVISTSVSASACDLSCWLHQIHSDCHHGSSAANSKDDMAMSMPPDMDMGSDHSGSSMGPDTVVSATPAPSMSMSPQIEMAAERFDHATKPDMRASAMHDPSKSMSSCAHETCTQIWTSASPSPGDHSQPGSLHRIAINISTPVTVPVAFYCVRVGYPPPRILASERLVTTLRI
jgi:hypothetical protein